MQRLFLAVFLILGAAPALASGRNPQLPSSGIVIHLFGPDAGIPERESATPPTAAQTAPAQPAPAQGVSASAAPAPASAAPAGTTPSAYPEPQLGTILHQMFITGDPNRGSGFSTGRPKAY